MPRIAVRVSPEVILFLEIVNMMRRDAQTAIRDGKLCRKTRQLVEGIKKLLTSNGYWYFDLSLRILDRNVTMVIVSNHECT